MNRLVFPVTLVWATLLVVLIGISGCANKRISEPDPIAKLPKEVTAFLEGKEVTISAQNGARGIIADTVLHAGGMVITKGRAEVEIKADVRQESSSYYHRYSPVPLIYTGPVYRIKVEVWVTEGPTRGFLRFHGVGTDTYSDSGQYSRNLAIEDATREALANLRGAPSQKR